MSGLPQYRGFVLQCQDRAWFSLNLLLVKTPHAFVFTINSWKNIPASHGYLYCNYTSHRLSSKDEILENFEFQSHRLKIDEIQWVLVGESNLFSTLTRTSHQAPEPITVQQ